MINEFMKVSPLRILAKSSSKELGKGNLGVLMARAGVGKTACLIHIAFDRLFCSRKLLHVSLEDVPEKITSYYNVIFYDLVKALSLADEQELKMMFERNRMILAYLNQSFELDRLRKNMQNLKDKIAFVPDTLIVDGMDFPEAGRDLFEGFKKLALDFDVEVWFSALSHRHITDANEKGIPYPCDKMDDLFAIIIQLNPTQSGIHLELLKDHDNQDTPGTKIQLDPNTFSALS